MVGLNYSNSMIRYEGLMTRETHLYEMIINYAFVCCIGLYLTLKRSMPSSQGLFFNSRCIYSCMLEVVGYAY